jgi:hypothetical protein
MQRFEAEEYLPGYNNGSYESRKTHAKRNLS